MFDAVAGSAEQGEVCERGLGAGGKVCEWDLVVYIEPGIEERRAMLCCRFEPAFLAGELPSDSEHRRLLVARQAGRAFAPEVGNPLGMTFDPSAIVILAGQRWLPGTADLSPATGSPLGTMT